MISQVQQGYKCDGSLRAQAGTRNLGSLKSGPGPIVNQTLHQFVVF